VSVSVWRIGFSGALQLDQLGYGSTLGDGRWHSGCRGLTQMVYAGSSRAMCQLERRVHCNGARPKKMALMRLDIPAKAPLLNVSKIGLAAHWRQDLSVTQQLGMQWLADKTSVGLWVPSFVESAEFNLLLNPQHSDYPRIQLVVEQNPFEFDPRFFI
jgi:RES domain-containing protein